MGSFFSSSRVILASMHGKEKVIAPVLERKLGWQIEVVPDLDTDCFGTFSGEVPREGTALDTARKKAMAALKKTGASMALASEGSFGPHPAIPFVASDYELLLLMDIERPIEILASALSVATNFAQKTISDWLTLEQFALSTGFPDHRLILKSKETIIKGIGDWSALRNYYNELNSEKAEIWVETDMRAMYNPMRMDVIAQAAEALTDKILSSCPACSAPGFEIQEAIPGLPCSQCHIPTKLAKAHRWACNQCGFTFEKSRSDGLTEADAAHCDWCNP